MVAQARAGATISYREAATRLGLAPPGMIARLAAALEALMEEDAAQGRPLLAALCVSRSGSGLPGRGFFDKAARLGRFAGDPDGLEARAFHAREVSQLLEAHRRNPAGPSGPS